MADESHALTANEVEEYLARIHFTGPIEPTLDILKDLQKCHILSVPFENLSVFGNSSLQRLVVRQSRSKTSRRVLLRT